MYVWVCAHAYIIVEDTKWWRIAGGETSLYGIMEIDSS